MGEQKLAVDVTVTLDTGCSSTRSVAACNTERHSGSSTALGLSFFTEDRDPSDKPGVSIVQKKDRKFLYQEIDQEKQIEREIKKVCASRLFSAVKSLGRNMTL